MIEYIATTKEWFDKVNGNSYFSSQVQATKNLNEVIKLPFQYGYGNHSEWVVMQELNLPRDEYKKIKFIKIDNCLKKEVVKWGEQA